MASIISEKGAIPYGIKSRIVDGELKKGIVHIEKIKQIIAKIKKCKFFFIV